MNSQAETPSPALTANRDISPHPRALRIVHWALVALICAQFASDLLLAPLESSAVRRVVLEFRASLDVLVLASIAAWLAIHLRLKQPGGRHSVSNAQIAHRAMMLALGVAAAFGVAAAWARGNDIRILGLVTLPPLLQPTVTEGVRLETWHRWLSYGFFALLLLHVGGLMYRQIVGRQRLLQRMLPPPPAGRLIDRVPLVAQLALCFGAILALFGSAGIYAAHLYQTTNQVRVEFDAVDGALLDSLEGSRTTLGAAIPSQRLSERRRMANQVGDVLEIAAPNLSDPEARGDVLKARDAVAAWLASDRSTERLESGAASLDAAITAQRVSMDRKRTAISQGVAIGHDLILLAVGAASILCLLMAYLLGRSLLAGVSAARRIVRSIEEDEGGTIDVYGHGEFAVLVREMMRTRDVVAARLDEGHRIHADLSRQAMEREAVLSKRITAEQAQIVDQVAHALSALAAGSLDYRINEPFPGDYDRIRDDFNRTIAKLESAMETISYSSEAIGLSSRNVAQEADSLAMRSKRQTSTLSGMAAALDRMTAEIQVAADGALQGAEAVSSVRTAAESSGKVVDDAIRAMDDIEKSSARIVEVINVIDTFASRSNLLALNARIEAARAGESGRGFAVVAQEVHGLARRAGEAAREIRTLIAESSRHVGTGVTLVQETGRVLQNIVGEVGQVDTVVAGVAASAHEQAVRLARVNGEMRELDRIAHENAATVGETTAALQAIRDTAATLDGLIKRLMNTDDSRGATIISRSRKVG